MTKKHAQPDQRCRFCDKSQTDVKKFIIISGGLWDRPPIPETPICNECIELFVEFMADVDPVWRDEMIEKLKQLSDTSE